MTDRARVVVIEDEASVREAVERALLGEGFIVTSFPDYVDPDHVLAIAPDLAVVDVMLPGGDGFALARKLRDRREVAVVFLTARDAVEDRVAGFGLGADDYLVKPFALEELLARDLSLAGHRLLPARESHNPHDLVDVVHDSLDHHGRLLVLHALEELS